MQNAACNPYSLEEVESRFQELRAQRVRAEQLYYSYAPAAASDDADDADDDVDAGYDE